MAERENHGWVGHTANPDPGGQDRQQAARWCDSANDAIALGVTIVAIVLFVAIGGTVLPQIAGHLTGQSARPDMLLANALLLNIALIVLGRRRLRELTRELAERRRTEEQARLLALTDPLTGSLNRRSFMPRAETLIAAAERARRAVACLNIDLDHFKQINDANGHKAGDAILVEMARRIRALAPEGALVARLGGDEFAVMLDYEPVGGDRVSRLAGDIVDHAQQPIAIGGGREFVATLSVGVAATVFAADTGGGGAISGHPCGDGTPVLAENAGAASTPPASAPAVERLLHMADLAMYAAKKGGRNRYEWFDPSMEHALRFRSQIESGIRDGLVRGEFIPYYEQQIDLDSGDLTGFEMLARWHSPRLGVVSPEVFIPVAEEIGLISSMSEALIRQALADAREWHSSLTLSVNISPVQLRDPWFAQKLLKLLAEANFPPRRLEVEITESCLHENVELARSLIVSLKNQGVRVSLDDFGTGYSSIAQLRLLPFDRIKIDRNFIASFGEDRQSDAIVEAITSMGKGMSLRVTAEGIETEPTREALRRMGRLKGQGYLYGRPEPAEAVRERLHQWHLHHGGDAAPEAAATIRPVSIAAPRGSAQAPH